MEFIMISNGLVNMYTCVVNYFILLFLFVFIVVVSKCEFDDYYITMLDMTMPLCNNTSVLNHIMVY